ncbi:PCYCGC motif-containing (lipo)protein [Effusibacillus consociatus]|uniref:PCYCGC motif-containing (Lipo)protein n=1 Tax=Effusibacillus consociatus TaxID=1117041 RepID=A0ABV9Q7Z1_9BACL
MKKLLLLIALSFVFAGCSQTASPNKSHDAQHNHLDETKGDIQQTTASTDELPSFVTNKPETTQLAYKLAAKNDKLLQQIPCYCGCGESAGHKHNADCFVKEVKPGSVMWDSHGTKCGVCMAIAVESVKLQSEGKSVKEIRSYIDTKYSSNGMKPTPTPMPN